VVMTQPCAASPPAAEQCTPLVTTRARKRKNMGASQSDDTATCVRLPSCTQQDNTHGWVMMTHTRLGDDDTHMRTHTHTHTRLGDDENRREETKQQGVCAGSNKTQPRSIIYVTLQAARQKEILIQQRCQLTLLWIDKLKIPST
jgi:hypothetical protein